MALLSYFLLSSRRRHTGCALVTGVQTCALPIYSPDAPFTKIKLVSFNPASRPQIADRLKLLYDWIPVEFTESGAPKVDETTLGSLDHIPAAKLLVEYQIGRAHV